MDNTKKVPVLRFPEFSGEWKEEKLGKITIKVGSGSTPRGGEEVYQNSGIPFIRSQNVNNDYLNLKDLVYIPENINNQMQGSIVKANDILLNITGASIGRSCIVPIDFDTGNVNQHVCIIRLKPDYNPKFFQLYLSSSRGQKSVLSFQVGSGREGLNFQAIRSFNIYSPALPEQQKIADFLTQIDNKISQLSQKKQLLESYKKGVMQQIFSQEIRFTDDDGREFPEWEEKSLGEIATFSKGKGISKADINEDGYLECIRYGELYTFYRETIRNIKSKTNVDKDDLVLSKYNDVIIPASGETQLDIAKASCVLKDGVALGGDLNIIRTKLNGVFLSYYLNSTKKQDIASLSQGISVVHLYASQLKLLDLNIPVLLEQTKIANFLTALDEKITLVEKQLHGTKQYKKGLLQQLFV